MENYTFRLAKKEDKNAIVAFVNEYWGSKHPLVNIPAFFDYYYNYGDDLHFALAEREGQIAALVGYIPSNYSDNPDYWTSLWVANPAEKGSGLDILANLIPLTGGRYYGCNNIRPSVVPLYRFVGFEAERMPHFYRLANVDKYRVARIQERDIPPVSGNATLTLLPTAEELSASGFVPPAENIPYKDIAYMQKRYYTYPLQSYDVYAATLPGEEKPFAILATRTIPVDGTAVLRICDYVGNVDMFPQLGQAIDDLMQQNGAEYCEMYCVGLSTELMRSAGFTERTEDSPNIIPHYLNPPLYENVEYYYSTTHPEGYVMFNADGDQDRPNVPLP